MTYNDEINRINSPEFKLGEYIYMGMAKVKDHTVCISVGYKIDYCLKKAKQFQSLVNGVYFYKINKVKIGDLEQCDELIIEKQKITLE